MFSRFHQIRQDRCSSRQNGFTLIELLIVVAIIGIIAAILIPNLLDALQKAKQKRTLADMKLVGTAWMSWLTDQASASAAGSAAATFDISTLGTITYDDLTELLTPQYALELPEIDGWKYDFQFYRATDFNVSIPMALRSRGADGAFDGTTYTIAPFLSTDYQKDIVWAGGFFISWPSGLQ